MSACEIWMKSIDWQGMQILVLIVYYNFKIWYYWEYLGEGQGGDLYHFGTFLWVYNYCSKKSFKSHCESKDFIQLFVILAIIQEG